jgi:hypothetical protein
MLTVSEQLFSSDEVNEIKVWLKQPGAALFCRAIQNDIVKLQIEASEDQMEGLDEGKARFTEMACGKLRKVRQLQSVLKAIDHAKSSDFKPFTAIVTPV